MPKTKGKKKSTKSSSRSKKTVAKTAKTVSSTSKRKVSILATQKKKLELEKARLDARLSKVQKEFFEYAASIGGYTSLSAFIIQSAQEKASRIVEEYNQFLNTENDKNIFFDALMNPPEANSALKEAAKEYKKQTAN